MITITDKAKTIIQEVYEENTNKKIRVVFKGIGWGGPKLGLALDKPNKKDSFITINDIELINDPAIENIAKYYGEVVVDYATTIYGNKQLVVYLSALSDSSC